MRLNVVANLPSLKWIPSPNYNSRRGTRVDQIIIHDTEGAYASAVAWFRQKASQVSAHFVVREDGGEATQMVHLSDRAWHACAVNSRSVGIEMAGSSKAGYSEALLEGTAALAAELCHFLQVPVRHARGGIGPGIESHWGLGKAGGGHSDPSTDPAWMERFIACVQSAYDKGYDPHYFDFSDQKPCALTAPETDGPKPRPAIDLATTAGLQSALNALGAHLAVDGDFGPESIAALKAFQTEAGLTPDGVPGPQTDAVIRKALSVD